MKRKTIVGVGLLAFAGISLIWLVVKEATGRGRTPGAGEAARTADLTAGSKVVVYYFYGKKRCDTCRTIEAYAREAVRTRFARMIESGGVEWRPLNVELAENEHFVEDFELVSRAVVVAEIKGGRRARWKNLDRIWDLVGDKPAFLDYIRDELREYAGGG
jgi:hypothetical protein